MQDTLKQILDFLQKNQLLLTALGIGGAGTLIFWLKGIPQAIYAFFKREFTTELYISNQNRIFYDILKLVEKMYRDKNLRKFKLTNGMWGNDRKTIMSMGYGTHLLKYKKTFLLVTLSKVEANQTERDKDSLSFLKFGRGHKVFDDILEEAEKMEEDKTQNRLYKMDGSWEYIKNQKKRPLESIFIEEDKRKLLLKTIDDFLSKEEWYLNNGIPYQLGIIFHGPPGTGKTSLIKALASYLDYNIYYLPVGQLHKIENASATLPDKCLMVIEDIDSNFVTMKRDEDDEDDEESPVQSRPRRPIRGSKSPAAEILDSMGDVALSELLNSLDGLFSPHGRILIATTNHIEKLDTAIIRPGRFDLKMEIGYVNKEILKEFFDNFFPNNSINLNGTVLKKKLSIADLQNLILIGETQEEILKYCKEQEK